MENLEIYKNVFLQLFGVDTTKLEGLKYQEISEWDSVGHMTLMGTLEDVFEIEMDIDDIIEFSSFKKGIEILKKYNVEILM